VEEHLISAAADRGRARVIVIFARPEGGESRLGPNLVTFPSPNRFLALGAAQPRERLSLPPKGEIPLRILSYWLAFPAGSFLSSLFLPRFPSRADNAANRPFYLIS